MKAHRATVVSWPAVSVSEVTTSDKNRVHRSVSSIRGSSLSKLAG
jgi:hypothetical protein